MTGLDRGLPILLAIAVVRYRVFYIGLPLFLPFTLDDDDFYVVLNNIEVTIAY